MDYQFLKEKHRQLREEQEKSLSIRIHRSLSWLIKAEQEDDDDAKFIFLWICFNAAYAGEQGIPFSERGAFTDFIQTIVKKDNDKQLQHLLFKDFSGSIRVLISNKYIFEPFWRALRERDASNQWEQKFQKSIQSATISVFEQKTDIVLGVVFDRLYVLRNQLIHGGATWQSELNRAQVKDGTKILGRLIPVILNIMIEETKLGIGEIAYPVI
jgi:hypothetical protein